MNTPPPTSSRFARKGRAFRSLGTLLTKQGGHNVLYGYTRPLAAAVQTCSQATGTAAADVTRTGDPLIAPPLTSKIQSAGVPPAASLRVQRSSMLLIRQ